jgi:hypothetical protein
MVMFYSYLLWLLLGEAGLKCHQQYVLWHVSLNSSRPAVVRSNTRHCTCCSRIFCCLTAGPELACCC